VVTGYTVLERAGLIPPAAGPQVRVAPSVAPKSSAPALELSRDLEAMIAETEAELGGLPIFVRPLARNGFKAKAGLSLKEWVRTAHDLTRRLEDLGAGDAVAEFDLGADLPRLQDLLGKLMAYYQGVPGETARFMKDEALLREIAEVSAARVATIRALMGALSAI